MYETYAPLGVSAASSGVLGFLSGYAAKKLLKLILFLIGLQLGVLAVLENHGIISVRMDRLNEAVTGIAHSMQVPTFIGGPEMAGLGTMFGLGAVYGLKRA